MTIFELFPWFIAVGVAIVSAALLENKFGVQGLWAWVIAAVLGGASWTAYWLVLKKLAPHIGQRRAENEKREVAQRAYQQFDPTKDYPAAKNFYYECPICGNVVPSMRDKTVSCKCRNLTVDNAGHVAVENPGKIKVFSLPA